MQLSLGLQACTQMCLQAVASPCLQVIAWTLRQHVVCMFSSGAYFAGRVVGPNSKPAPHCLVQQQGPDFSLLAPRLRQEWDSEKNQHIGNVQVKPYSSKVLAWICPEGTADDPHCWDARVYSRTRGTAVHTVLESK